jgi:hypothetical protein
MTTATAQRSHGTRACYAAGCRRPECAKANRTAENHRQRMILYGTWQPYVDASRARQHVRDLGVTGTGWKTAAHLAGLSTSTISRLVYGGPGTRPPTRRIRTETEQKILAVKPGLEALRPHRPTGAIGTRRRLQALIACGYSGACLARRLGMSPQNFGTMLTRGQVLAATARAAEGWQRPAQITLTYLLEDAQELLAQGHTRDQAAQRLEVSRDSLNTALARARRRAS